MGNFLVAIFAFPLAVGGVLLETHTAPYASRLLQGFDAVAWTVVYNNVLAGLVTSLVLKLAGAVTKAFAAAVALVFTCILSAQIFHSTLAPLFVLGACLVLTANVMYGLDARLGDLCQMAR